MLEAGDTGVTRNPTPAWFGSYADHSPNNVLATWVSTYFELHSSLLQNNPVMPVATLSKIPFVAKTYLETKGSGPIQPRLV